MQAALVLAVRFHDGRYHGAGAWPPAPARLFQALVAGAARGSGLAAVDCAALGWLEGLEPPIIAAPVARQSRAFTIYVPNNDLDSVGGDPTRIGEIRAAKVVRPRLFNAALPLVYAWTFQANREVLAHARTASTIAEHLYQLGRGVDMAWARAEIVDVDELDAHLTVPGTTLFRPTSGDRGLPLLCPHPGSLQSLEQRFAGQRRQFSEQRMGRKVQTLFMRPNKPLFRLISYNAPSAFLLFELRQVVGRAAMPKFAPQPVTKIAALVESLRDAAAQRLHDASPGHPDHAAVVERVFVGRGASDADKAARIRITPLPSIGHVQANQSIRRVLVEIPPDCPFPAADVQWSFAGLDLTDQSTGEILATLFATDQRGMLRNYGIMPHETRRVWRTVTPAALPHAAARRRIDPRRLADPSEWKDAPERQLEESRAIAAVRAALRHVEIGAGPIRVQVQREPFSARGLRGDAFAPGTRFAKARLWHVQITFPAPVQGPLIIGDGRYLGLGLMQPVDGDLLVFQMPAEPRVAFDRRGDLLNAVRRALMACARRDDGGVPRLFSGHEPDGTPAASGQHDHVFLAAADLDRDGWLDRLLVMAPWVCDRSVQINDDTKVLFNAVGSELRQVRAGALGVLELPAPVVPDDGNALIGPARIWESHTCYRPTRHPKRNASIDDAVKADVLAECERRRLPAPTVEIANVTYDSPGELLVHLRLLFPNNIKGPVLLGRDSHRGGGLFLAIR